MEILIKEKFAYLPVPKNASTTYINFFRDNGWQVIKEETSNLDKDTIFFGHIQDPYVRHTKGVAEFLRRHHTFIDLESCKRLLISGIFDVHTYPISSLFPRQYDRATWIPMNIPGANHTCNIMTNRFFEINNIKLRIPEEHIMHTSTEEFSMLCDIIDQFKQSDIELYCQTAYNMMSEDERLYHQAVEQFRREFK